MEYADDWEETQNTNGGRSKNRNKQVECHNCGKKMRSDHLRRHQRSCYAMGPFKTKNDALKLVNEAKKALKRVFKKLEQAEREIKKIRKIPRETPASIRRKAAQKEADKAILFGRK